MTTEDALTGQPTRRGFLLGLAAATSLPILLEPSVEAQTAASSPAAQTAAPNPEVDVQMAMINLRYGSYLKSTDLPLLRRSLERQQASIATVLKVPITNADAPDFLFSPDGL